MGTCTFTMSFVDLGDHGKLWVRPANMLREDIMVPFETEQLRDYCAW